MHARNLLHHIKKLRERNEQGILGLAEEFRKLSNPHQARRLKQGTGSLPMNRSKNRLANILPCKNLWVQWSVTLTYLGKVLAGYGGEVGGKVLVSLHHPSHALSYPTFLFSWVTTFIYQVNPRPCPFPPPPNQNVRNFPFSPIEDVLLLCSAVRELSSNILISQPCWLWTTVSLIFTVFLYFPPLDESTRVQLLSARGIEGSDYINASFIDVSTPRPML